MKTNVILIHTHDTGRYLEPYGAPVSMPNIMDFTSKATLFRNAHCTGPTCSPSRAAMMTGLYPHCNGMLGLAHRGFKLNDYKQHMVEFFNKNGYETVLSGIQHIAADRGDIAYSQYIGNTDFEMSHSFDFDSEKYDKGNAEAAADYITGNTESVFFLSFGMFNTHRTFPKAGNKINPDMLAVPMTIADTRPNREDMAGFHQSLAIVDECVGIIMKALSEADLWDRTIVLFTTDHGMPFPEMKCTLSDRGTGVSFIMHYPGNPSAGKACDALISHLDLYPTLCDLLQLSAPPRLQGLSLKPLFENAEKEIREEIFSEISFHAAYEPVRAIRTKRYKLIRRFDIDLSPVPANADGCPAKNDLIEAHYYRDAKLDVLSLYDLKIDPLEKNNLAEVDSYRIIRKEMEDRLQRWMEETDDPLIIHGGVIPIPPGGMVNKQDCIEPVEYDFI